MEPVSMTTMTLVAFLSIILSEGGKTLTVEGIKLAFEKRKDIREGFINLFQPEEITQLRLNEKQEPDEILDVIKRNPDQIEELSKRIKAESELIDKLEKFLIKQEGRTINAKNYIENLGTGNFY